MTTGRAIRRSAGIAFLLLMAGCAAIEQAGRPTLDTVAQPCVFLSETSCMIRNLPVLDADDPLDLLDLFSDYTFTVIARNEMGDSASSPASATNAPPPNSPAPSTSRAAR